MEFLTKEFKWKGIFQMLRQKPLAKSYGHYNMTMHLATASPPKKKYMRIFENKVKVICNEIVMKCLSFSYLLCIALRIGTSASQIYISKKKVLLVTLPCVLSLHVSSWANFNAWCRQMSIKYLLKKNFYRVILRFWFQVVNSN